MRLHRLDGLRGIAAMVVLLHHCLLTIPVLAAPYFSMPSNGIVAAVMARMPLHLLWDGSAAVSLFFVLSGFVLTLATQRAGLRWLRFDLQRLIRLYLPVWGALVLTVLLAALIRRDTYGGDSIWVHKHAVPILPEAIEGAIVVRREIWMNSVLWSLKWEVIFSLALPAYLALGRCLSRVWPIVPVLCAVVSAIGLHIGWPYLTYLPIFLCGVVLAQHRDTASGWVSRAGQGRLTLIALLIGGAPWLLEPGSAQSGARFVAYPLASTLLVAACLVPGAVGNSLESRWAQWLGRISFSLYLVHEPLVVSLAVLGVPGYATPVLGIPLALVVAAVFYRFVERPAHWLAKQINVRPGVAPAPGATPAS